MKKNINFSIPVFYNNNNNSYIEKYEDKVKEAIKQLFESCFDSISEPNVIFPIINPSHAELLKYFLAEII